MNAAFSALSWRNPIHFTAFGFGIGTVPLMPGTFGSLLGVVLYFLLLSMPSLLSNAILGVLFLFGIYICGKTSRDIGVPDAAAIVWDEMIAFPLVLMNIPVHWYYVLAGFILFRIFDIWKPWPIRWIDQHIHGGLGIMLDDVLAALCAWLILYVIVLVVG